jgi:hypothetical protein
VLAYARVLEAVEGRFRFFLPLFAQQEKPFCIYIHTYTHTYTYTYIYIYIYIHIYIHIYIYIYIYIKALLRLY